MTKVAVLGEFALGADEGMAIASRRIAQALTTLGAETFDLTSAAENANERIAAVRAASQLRRGGPDLVYYVPKSGLTSASLARLAAVRRIVRCPVVLGCFQADGALPRIATLIRPDAVIVPSARLARPFLRGGMKADVIPLGVDRALFNRDGPPRTDLWPDRPGARVLHVGHLNARRNLEPIEKLSRAGYNCLVVASPSTRAHPAVVEALTSAAVSLVRGKLEDIAAVYRAADVYVFPVENPRGAIELPLSVLEALACGTPVVSTPFGGVPDLVREVSGLMVVESAQIADAVRETIIAPPEVDVDRIFDWKDVAQAHLEVFRRVLTPRANPRFVVFLGVDGTGKSTQAELLASAGEARGLHVVTIWARWKPFLLRPLTAVVRRSLGPGNDSSPTAYARQMSFKQTLFRLSAVRRLWEWLASIDHGLQTIPRVAAARRSAQLVIADRYYQDALVDMGANFGLTAPPPRGLFRIFPRPDCVIVLDATEEAILERKGDIPSPQYLRHRRPLYLELAQRNGWPVVDATKSAAEVHAAVSDIVWSAS